VKKGILTVWRLLGVVGECGSGMCYVGAAVEGLYGCAGKLLLIGAMLEGERGTVGGKRTGALRD
jgi:ABC-type microcin C transport system duplicated ATPase subunit YejF